MKFILLYRLAYISNFCEKMSPAQEGYNGNCHPEKTTIHRGEAEIYSGFQGVTIFNVACTLLCRQYQSYYTECFKNTSSALCLVSKQSRHVNFSSDLLFVFRISLDVQQMSSSESMVNRTRINSAQSIFLWNITCHRAISSIAEFHHVLGCCFMIQWVILIFFSMWNLGNMKNLSHG